jgi:asparagine synthase (glutamine-hydrolysing)
VQPFSTRFHLLLVVSEVASLLEAIDAATADAIGDRRVVAVAYSGGLDSSLVAAIAGKRADVRCYAACTRTSHDHECVRSYADEQSLDAGLTLLSADDVRRFAAVAVSVLGAADPVSVAYTIPLLAVLDSVKEDVVLTGGVADELFAGYAKYALDARPERQMMIDLEKALFEYERVRLYAEKNRINLASPYADQRVIEVANSIPLQDKVNPAGRKLVLRRLAEDLGLRSHDRPKKAAQYSSGVMKEMKRLAREDGKALDEWTRALSAASPSQVSNRA